MTSPTLPATSGTPPRSRLRAADVRRLAGSGLRARPVRAVLSAVGIAIGIAAMLAVLGISSSSQARLNAQLERLGTNLLTVQAGQSLTGQATVLPPDSLGKVRLVDGIRSASSIGQLKGAQVYRSELTDPAATGGLVVAAADAELLEVVRASVRVGSWLNGATGRYPAVVLGATAAQRLGVVAPGTQVWLGDRYFTVVGILDPVALAPELDTAALVGEPVAADQLGYDGSPTTVYERSRDSAVNDVRALLPGTVSPQAPEEVKVSRPSDALAAKDAADQAFSGLLVGLGSVALLVGGIGVANTMIISVIERRREIGLRRALGATRGHIRAQFLAEALLLSALGGVIGIALGIAVTAVVALGNGWPVTVSPWVPAAGLGVSVATGAIAGLYPATRAAATPPTTALSS